MHRTLIAILSVALVISLALLVFVYQKYASQKSALEAGAGSDAGQSSLMVGALLKKLPGISVGAANTIRLGESRTFFIRIYGVMPTDSITSGPFIEVNRDGRVVETFDFRDPQSGIRDSSLENLNGTRTYVFTWKPKAAGDYQLWIKAGTNYMQAAGQGEAQQVKIGNAQFPRAEVQAVIDGDPALKGTPLDSFFQRCEQLDPVRLTITVTP